MKFLEFAMVGGLAFCTGLGVGLAPLSSQQRAHRQIHALSEALNHYELNGLRFPTTRQGLAALVSRPTSEPLPWHWEPLLDRVPVDPWGRNFFYAYPGTQNRHFDLWSLGPDGKPSADDIGNRNPLHQD